MEREEESDQKVKDDAYSKLLKYQIEAYKKENRHLEFKSNYQDAARLGKYISALSNGACLDHEDYGYLYFGVEDATLAIKGSTFKSSSIKAEGNQDLELWLRQQIFPRIEFKIEEFNCDGKRIVRFQIPAAKADPTKFNWKAFARIDSHVTALEQYPGLMKEIYNSQVDWTAEIIEGVSLDDLDPEAIKLARQGYKERYPQFAEECDKWTDEVFLDKACLTRKGKITRTTLLLVGKEEIAFKLNHIAQISWKCFQDNQIFGDLFTIPFVRTTTELVGRIRNYRFKIYPPYKMIPAEIWKYDPRSILEGLHNCLAHMDYTLNKRIIVKETIDALTFESPGGFYEGNYEEYVLGTRTPELYRNPALMKAMVNIKMIDSQGYGIHNLYTHQMERYLPMPDYEGTSDSKVILRIPGVVIDENYSFLLINNPKVTLEEAFLLDRVQKGQRISDSAIAALRKKKMIEGRKPHIFVAKPYAYSIGQKVEYSQHKGLDTKTCEHIILEALKDHGYLTRDEINKLLLPALSDQLDSQQKKDRIKYIIAKMRRNGLLVNSRNGSQTVWKLTD